MSEYLVDDRKNLIPFSAPNGGIGSIVVYNPTGSVNLYVSSYPYGAIVGLINNNNTAYNIRFNNDTDYRVVLSIITSGSTATSEYFINSGSSYSYRLAANARSFGFVFILNNN